MTGKAFIKLITHKRIPLSCIAHRLDCKLSTLQGIESLDAVPKHYVIHFIAEFQESLSEQDVKLLTH